MLTSYVSGLGAPTQAHEQHARTAMGQVRQRLTATQVAKACGAKLDHMFWAFMHLGTATAHVESMSGPTEYAMKALLQVLKRDVEMMWRSVRTDCRL